MLQVHSIAEAARPVEVREIARDSREILIGRACALLAAGLAVALLLWLYEA